DSNGTISKVEFFAGATLLGTSTTAPYSFTWTNVAAGSYSLTAKATDNGGLSTTSAAVNITVSNVPPTVSLTSPTNGATFTAGANITLTANAADSNGTISKVEFFAGATLLGTSTTAPYSFTWNNVAAGSYSLTAKATDNGGLSTTSTAVNITVSNVPPTVSLTAPTNGATFTAGANITLTANAADSNGTISKVEFFAGGTLLGTSTTAPYSFTWNNVAAGSYSLTAKATDNSGLSTTSAAVNITVNATINAPPTVTLTSPANGTKFSAGTNITLTASASDRDGSIAKVEFFAGSTLLGTATASPWSITWNSVSAGSYALTAKATDNGGLSATSSVVNISVKRKPSVALTSPSDGTTLRAGSDITISADAVASDGSITSVEFFDGTTLLGTATQSPYSIPWNSIAAGSYAISAIATDDLGVSTASPAIRINVVADTPPEVTSPAKPGQNSVVPGQEATFSVGASGDNLQYVWDFGDGSSGTGATATHVYTSPGIYTATVTITNASGSSVSSSTQVVVLGALTVSKLSGAVHFKMTGRDTCSLKGTLAEIPQDFKPEGQIVSIEIGNVPATFTLTKNGLGRSGSNSFALKIPHGRKSAAQRTANFSTTLRGDFVPVWSAIGLDSASTSSTFTMTVNLNINQKGYTVAIPVSYTGKPGMSGRFTKR
ncbi:MAG TPA: Ig-like domain-containing protein, partial [Planctomycetota bacterium]|nr:Ig-like domain-containing protein [Planctomycetota bacterium]